MPEQNCDFFYLRNASHPTTVAYKVDWKRSDDSKAKQSDLRILFAAAYCSHKDSFSKKIGRTIASGRLNRGLDHTGIIYIRDIDTTKPGQMWYNIRLHVSYAVITANNRPNKYEAY
jgi:hypothetical protein